jgi:transcriptional regulator with GAF, ATPase, and Fis domain
MKRDALTRTLYELTDALVKDFDVVDLLTMLTERCVETLETSEAGIMLVPPGGSLGVMAASTESVQVLELLEVQAEGGPSLDCIRTGTAVGRSNLTTAYDIWPQFAPECLRAGFQSVLALPIRLRGETIGALNLFRDDNETMEDSDIRAGQAFADFAAIAIHLHLFSFPIRIGAERLRNVLDSRVVIEQAKGMLSHMATVDVETTFGMMRSYARAQGLGVVDVARGVIDGTLTAHSLLSSGKPPST